MIWPRGLGFLKVKIITLLFLNIIVKGFKRFVSFYKNFYTTKKIKMYLRTCINKINVRYAHSDECVKNITTNH
jgi:hypothetical protein